MEYVYQAIDDGNKLTNLKIETKFDLLTPAETTAISKC